MCVSKSWELGGILTSLMLVSKSLELEGILTSLMFVSKPWESGDPCWLPNFCKQILGVGGILAGLICVSNPWELGVAPTNRIAAQEAPHKQDYDRGSTQAGLPPRIDASRTTTRLRPRLDASRIATSTPQHTHPHTPTPTHTYIHTQPHTLLAPAQKSWVRLTSGGPPRTELRHEASPMNRLRTHLGLTKTHLGLTLDSPGLT